MVTSTTIGGSASAGQAVASGSTRRSCGTWSTAKERTSDRRRRFRNGSFCSVDFSPHKGFATCGLKSTLCSRQELLHDLSVHIGQPIVAALETEREPFVVDSQQMQERRVEVVDVDAVRHDVVAEGTRLAVEGPALDAAAGHPEAEAPRVMIAAVVGRGQSALRIVGAAE